MKCKKGGTIPYMREDNRMTRRGMLRGDWFKVIRARGAEQLKAEEEAEPIFRIKAPVGRSQRGDISNHPTPQKGS